MTGDQLTKHRATLSLTQQGMADLLGCSLIGYKRFESDARPIPDYIAHCVVAVAVCDNNDLLPALKKALKSA